MHLNALIGLGGEVSSAIAGFTPECFDNLLSRELDRSIGPDRKAVRIAPDVTSIRAKNDREGVQFSIEGTLTLDDRTTRKVVIHGIRDDDVDEPCFRSIERAGA